MFVPAKPIRYILIILIYLLVCRGIVRGLETENMFRFALAISGGILFSIALYTSARKERG